MSKLLRVLVVDDEAPARSRAIELLEDCAAALPLKVVGQAGDGLEAVAFLNEHAADVMFVDIRMPEMDGIELARHVQRLAQPPAVIFTTAYDAYAVKAFELNAVDYLLKPLRQERLAAALQKAAHSRLITDETLIKLGSKARTHLSINERGRVILVPMAEVLFLRAELKYITVRTAQRELILEESLVNLETEFKDSFVRVHRNCLVARAAIAGFERVSGGDGGDSYWAVLLKGIEEKLPVSRRQQHIVRELKG